MQFNIMPRMYVWQFTLVLIAKCHSTISWIMSNFFPKNWFQDISMCIDIRQSIQLCPYHMGFDHTTVHTCARSKMPQHNIVNNVNWIQGNSTEDGKQKWTKYCCHILGTQRCGSHCKASLSNIWVLCNNKHFNLMYYIYSIEIKWDGKKTKMRDDNAMRWIRIIVWNGGDI